MTKRRSLLNLAACCGALSVLLGLAAPAPAAAPRDELLRMVPDDVGFCLVIQDLRNHSATLLASPFVQTLRQAPGEPSMGLQKLDEVDRQLEKLLGVSWSELRDEVLGDCVVFAYRPGPTSQPGQEQGLALVWARKPEVLTGLIERLNAFQKSNGDLKELQERTYRDQKYFHRVEKKEEGFYYQRGRVLVFATREELLKQAIDRQAAPGDESFVARQFRLLGAEKKLAALWINPRAFDAAMEHSAIEAQGQQAAFLRNFLRYWKALDGIALSGTVERDLELELAIQARPTDLPPAAQRFLAEAAKPSALWSRCSENTMLAVCGRFDAAALYEVIAEFLTPEDRQAMRGALERTLGAVLDRDLVKDVLPYLGPDWGFLVMAPAADDRSWLPQLAFAVAVRPGADRAAPVDQLLLSAVEFAARLWVLSYNQQHKDQVVLKTTTQDQTRVHYLANDQGFPPGIQPAFALQGGFLVLANSPEVVRRLGQAATGAPVVGKEEVLVLRASVKQFRIWFKERFEPLAAYLAEKNGITREEAGRRMNEALAILQLVEEVELTQRSEKGQVRLTLHIRLAQSLK